MSSVFYRRLVFGNDPPPFTRVWKNLLHLCALPIPHPSLRPSSISDNFVPLNHWQEWRRAGSDRQRVQSPSPSLQILVCRKGNVPHCSSPRHERSFFTRGALCFASVSSNGSHHHQLIPHADRFYVSVLQLVPLPAPCPFSAGIT